MIVNRIALVYQDSHQVIDDEDAYGIYNYQIASQGQPPRPARTGKDLFAARSWLETSGFQCTETEVIGRAYAHNGYKRTFRESWHLHPSPALVAEQKKKEAVRMRTMIRYNRSAREYELTARRGTEILGAFATRDAATVAQVEAQDPALADLYHRFIAVYPRFESRALKAAHAVMMDQIQLNGSHYTYEMISTSHMLRTYAAYVPLHDPAAWTCTICDDDNPDDIGNLCPDHEHATAPISKNGRRCKHQIAAVFRQLLDNAATDPPPQEKAPTVAAVGAQTETRAPVKDDNTTDMYLPSRCRIPDGIAAPLALADICDLPAHLVNR